MKIRRISALITALFLLSVSCLTSCDKAPEEIESSTGYEYIPSGQESTTVSDNTDLQKEIKIDTSWQKNFTVKYSYYNPEQSITTMKIEEKKSANAFTVEYLDTGSLLYYKANGNDTDYYVIIDNEDEQVHSVLEGKKFSSLSSMFMKLSVLSPELPTQSNVLYMYEEAVAGRPCHKYIQRAYSDGKLTESVYVWVDAQFGFAAKCEAYDAEDNLTVMWEVESFSEGDLQDSDVFIDLTEYTFKEEIG
ncbi:MAG: hypothetical protein IKL10_06500 [Clostridia bacterium]|nr:hypothetical protein [Clostridia bacterium]